MNLNISFNLCKDTKKAKLIFFYTLMSVILNHNPKFVKKKYF